MIYNILKYKNKNNLLYSRKHCIRKREGNPFCPPNEIDRYNTSTTANMLYLRSLYQRNLAVAVLRHGQTYYRQEGERTAGSLYFSNLNGVIVFSRIPYSILVACNNCITTVTVIELISMVIPDFEFDWFI